MARIIAYLAASADGYIARRNGDVGWLDRPSPPGNYGMGRFYASVDTVVMGRKTFDLARRFGQDAYPGKVNYVLSRRRRPGRAGRVAFVRGPIRTLARRLRREARRDVWLVGGAEVFAAFLDAGELDEVIVHVIPVLIGAGIPLLSPRRREVQLRLLGSRRYPDGVVELHYAVRRSRRAAA